MKKHVKSLLCLALSAVFCLSAVGCSCGKRRELQEVFEDNDDYYEITYFLPITTDGISLSFPSMQDVEDAINEIIYPKINARVNFVQMLWFTYNEQMTTRINSGESFDLCFTSPTVNFYWTNIERYAFLPLNSLVDMYAPHIKAQVPEYAWKQATAANGKFYGVVNQQIIPRTDAALVQDYDLFDRFCAMQGYDGYDHTNIYEYILEQEIHPYEIMEDYVRWLKQNNKGMGGKMGALSVQESLQTRYHWDDLGTGMQVPGVVKCEDTADGGIKVFNQFETDEFKADIQRMADYFDTGLAPKTITTGDYGTAMETYDVASLATWKPNDVRRNTMGSADSWGGAVRLGNPYYYISYILGSMTAISSTSKNPARVMKFLDLLWTDSEILNLLCFGLEGEHYDYTDKENSSQVSIIPNSGYANYTMTWAYSSEFLDGVCYSEQYQDNPYVESKGINETAYLSDVVGFFFDEKPVASKIAQCKADAATYLREFSTGVHGKNVMKVYDEFISKMRTNGMDDIIAEKQRQLDAWLAANN